MTIEFTVESNTAHILINRPQKRNAFNQSMLKLLIQFLEETESSNVRALVIRSKSENVFCAGADISELIDNCNDAGWIHQNQVLINMMQSKLANLDIPTIAFIDGDCIGGGLGIALACDIRIATIRSRFGITPSKLGLVYPVHDTKLLVDIIGAARAKQLLFTARIIDASKALEIGLINEISKDFSQILFEIASNSLFSNRAMKKSIREILNGKTADNEDDLALFRSAFTKHDFIEGVSAFVNKRKPNFK